VINSPEPSVIHQSSAALVAVPRMAKECQQRKKLLGPLVSDVCGGTPSSIVGEDIAVTVAKSLNHLIGPLEQSRRDHQPALSDPRSTYRPTAHIPPSQSNERSLGVTLKIAA
jgi:hypothetical protein